MKHRNYLVMISFMLCIVSLSSVSAVISEIDPIKVGNCINLPQIEYNSSYQNITFILRPDGSREVIGVNMQKIGSSYNYSYCNTEIVGTYTANGCSDISCWNYKFSVTPSGYKSLSVFLFIFIIIIALVYAVGFKLENGYVMFFGSTLVLLFGFFIFIYGVDIIKDTKTTQGIAWIVWAMGIFSLFLSVQEMLEEWK